MTEGIELCVRNRGATKEKRVKLLPHRHCHVTRHDSSKCQDYEISQRIGGILLATLLRGVFK